MKKNILLMIVTAIIFTGIGVYATIQYQADEIGYGTGTIKDAIDDLYTTQNTTVSNLQNQNTALTSQVAVLQAQVDNPDCVSGTITCTTCDTTAGQTLISFIPNNLVLYGKDGSTWFTYYYNKDLYSSDMQVISSSSSTFISFNTKFKNDSNNNLLLYNINTSWNNKALYYMACK